jgi:hypothetical protein
LARWAKLRTKTAGRYIPAGGSAFQESRAADNDARAFRIDAQGGKIAGQSDRPTIWRRHQELPTLPESPNVPWMASRPFQLRARDRFHPMLSLRTMLEENNVGFPV